MKNFDARLNASFRVAGSVGIGRFELSADTLSRYDVIYGRGGGGEGRGGEGKIPPADRAPFVNIRPDVIYLLITDKPIVVIYRNASMAA